MLLKIDFSKFTENFLDLMILQTLKNKDYVSVDEIVSILKKKFTTNLTTAMLYPVIYELIHKNCLEIDRDFGFRRYRISATGKKMLLEMSDSLYKFNNLVNSKDSAILKPKQSAHALIDERTKELKNAYDDLIKKERELKKKNVELQQHYDLQSDFISIASHELRNPIQPIVQFAELAKKGIVSKDEALYIILKNAHHLTSLTNDILEVSRIDTGTTEYKLEPVYLENFLYDLVKMQRMKIEKKINIKFHPLCKAIVMADKIRLAQAINNILENSIKFTVKGEITLKILQSKKDFVDILIIDTGKGIPQDILPRIFERFVTKDEDVNVQKGTGLGLYICKSIINSHKGTISAKNNPKTGATFKIQLPVHSIEYEK